MLNTTTPLPAITLRQPVVGVAAALHPAAAVDHHHRGPVGRRTGGAVQVARARPAAGRRPHAGCTSTLVRRRGGAAACQQQGGRWRIAAAGAGPYTRHGHRRSALDQAMRFTVDRLDHIVVNCKDVEITASWYQRVLGMEREDFGEDGRTALKFGGQKLNLRPPTPIRAPGSPARTQARQRGRLLHHRRRAGGRGRPPA